MILEKTYGISYGAWIASRYTSVVGDPIVNPVYFIEYLLREEIGIDASKINTTSFDSVATARSSWKIAAQILNEAECWQIIDAICFEFGIKLVLEPGTVAKEEQFRMIALDDASSIYTITSADIAFEGSPQIAVEKTPLENIQNEYSLDYKINYATGEPESLIYISDDNGDNVIESNLSDASGALRTGSYTTWCQESVNRYKVRRKFSKTLEYIREAATAELCIKKLADWWTFPRLIVRMRVLKNINTVVLQRGDVVKVTDALLGSIHSGVTKFMVSKVNFPAIGKTVTPYINLEVEEIPNIHTGAKYYSKLAPIKGLDI